MDNKIVIVYVGTCWKRFNHFIRGLSYEEIKYNSNGYDVDNIRYVFVSVNDSYFVERLRGMYVHNILFESGINLLDDYQMGVVFDRVSRGHYELVRANNIYHYVTERCLNSLKCGWIPKDFNNKRYYYKE